MVRVKTATPSVASDAVDRAHRATLPARLSPGVALVGQHQRCRGGAPGERGIRVRSMRERALQRRAESTRVCGNLGQAKAPQRLVALPDVAVAEAVGDHRATADDRLEHGQTGAPANQRVARREHVPHSVGEAHQPHVVHRRTASRHARGARRFDRIGRARAASEPRARRGWLRGGRRPPAAAGDRYHLTL